MDEALLLREVVTKRQRDLHLTGFHAREARADQRHRLLAAEALADTGGESRVRDVHSLKSVVDAYVNVN